MSQLTEDILYATDITSLIQRYVSLRKNGKNRTGLCPFHKEKSPSFSVAEDKQIFKCFGCGKGGDAITFLMEIERIDFWDAIKMLARDAHIDLSKYMTKQKDPDLIQAQQSQREQLKTLNATATKYFSNQLIGSIADTYLMDERRLSSATIDRFQLGYAPDSYYDLVAAMKDAGYAYDLIENASLIKKNQNGEYYSFFRNRVIFPIRDHIGNIVAFAGRALTVDDMPKYLNISETPLYDKSKLLYGMHFAKQHIKEFNKLIIVEGYMDVIALHDAGLPIGVATCGTALTPHHMQLLKRQTDHIVFAFDGDTAGFEATLRALKVAYTYEIYPKILILPVQFKDIDEFVHSDQDYRSYLSGSDHEKEGFLYVLEHIVTKTDMHNPIYKKKAINICFDLLVQVQDYSILIMFLEQMAMKFASNQDMLLQQFKQHLKRSPTRKGISDTTQVANDQVSLLELRTAFGDEHFVKNFFGDGMLDTLHRLMTILHELQLIVPTEKQSDAMMWREYHYSNMDTIKRNEQLQSWIRRQFIPYLESYLIKSNHHEKAKLLQELIVLKRGV